jgi:hypothetical protein
MFKDNTAAHTLIRSDYGTVHALKFAGIFDQGSGRIHSLGWIEYIMIRSRKLDKKYQMQYFPYFSCPQPAQKYGDQHST